MRRFCFVFTLIFALCALPSWLMAQDVAHALAACAGQNHKALQAKNACPQHESPQHQQNNLHLDCCSLSMLIVTHDRISSLPSLRAPLIATTGAVPTICYIPPPERPPKA